MGDNPEFWEDRQGVHVMDPINAEFTLCGDAFDAWQSESDWPDGELKLTRKRTVTCPKCVAIIRNVRSIRTMETTND